MFAFLDPCLADIDATVLAVGVVVFVGFLIREIIRERRRERRSDTEQAVRDRSRKDHWGYS